VELGGGVDSAHPARRIATPLPRRLYILCWSELSRRRLLPAVSPAAGHLTTPTVAGLPGLCENFRPTTSKSSPILRLLSSHWATSVVSTTVVGVANVGDRLRRLSSLQHRIYNLLGHCQPARHISVSESLAWDRNGLARRRRWSGAPRPARQDSGPEPSRTARRGTQRDRRLSRNGPDRLDLALSLSHARARRTTVPSISQSN